MNQRLTVHLSTALAFGPIGIIWAFLPIYLRSLGATYLLIGLVSLIPAIETVGFSPAWGGVLDKTGRGNRILLISIMAQGVGFSLFPFLKTPVEFVLAVSLMGLFSASFIPVCAAMATLSNRHYGRAIGGFWTAALLGYASVTLLRGILYQYLPVDSLFVLGAIYGYAGTVVVLLAPKDAPTLTRSLDISRGYWGCEAEKHRDSLPSLHHRPRLNICFQQLLHWLLGRRSQRVTTDSRTGGHRNNSACIVAYRLVGPLNDKVGRKPVFMLGAAGYATYFTTLYFVTNVVVVTVLWILPIYPLVQSAAAAFMSDYTSTADRGKGLGLLESAISLGGGVGPLAGGLIADAAQLQTVIIASLVLLSSRLGLPGFC